MKTHQLKLAAIAAAMLFPTCWTCRPVNAQDAAAKKELSRRKRKSETPRKLANKPLLEDPSGSDSGLDYFSQGGVVVDGLAYFTADYGCSKYRKGEKYPFGVAFDVKTFQKQRTYAFEDTYDSCPLVVDRLDGTRLILAHEYKRKRTVARDVETGEVVWTSAANQPGAYFFGYSYDVREDGSKLILMACQNGLHALSLEDGKEEWWLQAKGGGGVTPCVDQAVGVAFYQQDGRIMKVRLSDGKVLKETKVRAPNRTVSWNTILANDEHGYYVATYWFGFVDAKGRKKMKWNAAVRVFDADLDLVWERTGLPCCKKATITYARGKLVVGTGGHWSGKYEGDKWKYVPAFAIDTGEEVWRCNLKDVPYQCIFNVPYAYGHFYAETYDKPGSKLLRIDADTGELEEVLDYGAPISSCAPCLIARGKVLSGDLARDGVVATAIAEGSRGDWPGPFCNPQTNTYALPDEPKAKLVPMREVYVGVRR